NSAQFVQSLRKTKTKIPFERRKSTFNLGDSASQTEACGECSGNADQRRKHQNDEQHFASAHPWRAASHQPFHRPCHGAAISISKSSQYQKIGSAANDVLDEVTLFEALLSDGNDEPS